MSGLIEEMVGNQKLIKALSYEERSIDRFKEINQRLKECGVKAQFYSSLTNPCTRFVNGIVYATVGVVGALFAIRGSITVGLLSSFYPMPISIPNLLMKYLGSLRNYRQP